MRNVIGHTATSVVLAVAIALLAIQFTIARADVPAATKWEYRVVKIGDFEPGFEGEWKDRLNILGNEGWELVSLVPPSRGTGCIATMKRPKQ